MSKPDNTFDISFRAVVYPDGDLWDAHALELDIVGCGATPEEAVRELLDLVECQVAYALQEGDPSLLFADAPAEIFELWEEGQKAARQELFDASAPVNSRLQAKTLGFTKERLQKLRKKTLDLVPCG